MVRSWGGGRAEGLGNERVRLAPVIGAWRLRLLEALALGGSSSYSRTGHLLREFSSRDNGAADWPLPTPGGSLEATSLMPALLL